MSNFDEGYPGHGGFYEPAPISDMPAPAKVEYTPDHLKLAQRHMDDYERLSMQRPYHETYEDDLALENRAYKLAMLNAALASAEAAARQAAVIESLMDFTADLFGGTNILNALDRLSKK